MKLRFYVPLNTKYVISEMFPSPISWLGIEKQNLTQQKHALTNQNKCTTTQNKHKKLKPGLVASYNIWPGNAEGLFWFWHFINKFVTYLLRHPLTHSLEPTRGVLTMSSSIHRTGSGRVLEVSLTADKEMMRPLRWLESVLDFLQCFDTVGWVTRRMTGV